MCVSDVEEALDRDPWMMFEYVIAGSIQAKGAKSFTKRV